MKRLHIFIIRSFIGPFIITFAIAMFFLVMQFLWKYVDDLMGKGLPLSTLLELLFYVSATLIPLALPLAILFSSIMTFGNLAENNELTALKSSGLSLFRIMRPMLIFTFLLSGFAFYFSNYILPPANLKASTIIYNIQVKKPAINIKPGVFYNDLTGYTIKVGSKNNNTGELKDLLIFENKGVGGKTIKASYGEMLKSQDTSFLLLRLENGVMYEENSITPTKRPAFPFQKSFFKEAIFKIDLSDFRLQQTEEELFRQEHEMMNFLQLDYAIDSLTKRADTLDDLLLNRLKSNITIFNPGFAPLPITMDSLQEIDMPQPEFEKTDTIIFLDSMAANDFKNALHAAQGSIRTAKDILLNQQVLEFSSNNSLKEYKTAWHKKFTLAFAVIVLFFIGAPLGAIIKKGGLGTPLVFATIFFLLYYILTISGENMVESDVIEPWKGMWLSSVILTPLGIFLTYKAANDSALFDRDAYKRIFNRIFGKK